MKEDLQNRDFKHEYLQKHIFNNLKDLNDGFDASGISYFTEAEFEIVLNRVKERGIGIYGIEPWLNNDYYSIDTFENHKTFPQDPNWYLISFGKFKALGLNLQYSASFYVPANFYEMETR